jgi:polyisoprenoid-binding protein YceI
MTGKAARHRSVLVALLGGVALVPGVLARVPRVLRFDHQKSALTFTIHRPGETIEGSAREFSGEVALDPERPAEGSSVELTVRSASLETGNRIRDRKMRSSHLEAERFPEIRFRSTSVRMSSGGGDHPGGPLVSGEERKALVEGQLTLHGVERTMLFPVSIRYDGASLTAEGTLVLSLTDHGIPIPRFLWIVLDDEVKVRFRFVAGAGRQGD